MIFNSLHWDVFWFPFWLALVSGMKSVEVGSFKLNSPDMSAYTRLPTNVAAARCTWCCGATRGLWYRRGFEIHDRTISWLMASFTILYNPVSFIIDGFRLKAAFRLFSWKVREQFSFLHRSSVEVRWCPNYHWRIVRQIEWCVPLTKRRFENFSLWVESPLNVFVRSYWA